MTKEIDAQIEELKQSKNIPTHIAIIMDGNGRWAEKRQLPRLEGHREGRESVRSTVRTCAKIGISYLTLYTFSLENWQRSKGEVDGLMAFLEDVLEREYEELNENGVRLHAIGRLDMLPEATRGALDRTIERLAHNTRLMLTLAISYSGRGEIVDAARRVAGSVRAGALRIEDVDEARFAEFLYKPDLPDPDLLIRTSGEMRISNFLLWQIAYTEIYVTDLYWPDFREQALIDSVRAYQRRERRFGL